MHTPNLIDTARRVLKRIQLRLQLDFGDVSILKSHALPEETALSVSELACELIKREIAKRRTDGRSVNLRGSSQGSALLSDKFR